MPLRQSAVGRAQSCETALEALFASKMHSALPPSWLQVPKKLLSYWMLAATKPRAAMPSTTAMLGASSIVGSNVPTIHRKTGCVPVVGSSPTISIVELQLLAKAPCPVYVAL